MQTPAMGVSKPLSKIGVLKCRIYADIESWKLVFTNRMVGEQRIQLKYC
jgi:hypothetical protein